MKGLLAGAVALLVVAACQAAPPPSTSTPAPPAPGLAVTTTSATPAAAAPTEMPPPPTPTPAPPRPEDTRTPVPHTSTPVPPTPTPVPPTPTARPTGVLLAPTAPPPGGKLRTIALDPGHGGPETGSAPSQDLVEKDVNLRIALVLADLLREEGFRVALTRETDRAVSPSYRNSGLRSQVVQDLQARVDVANGADAELFLSIHNNGSGDPSARGTEVWYNAARPFADRNLALAELVLENLLRQLREAGHSVVNRGMKDDASFRIWNGRAFNLYVLGPGPGYRPATEMPGALGESLFLTNPADAAALRRPAIVQAIARGYRDAVLRYLEKYPGPLEG